MKDLVLYSWKDVSVSLVERELDALLARQRARIAARLRRGPPYTWENFVAILDDVADELHKLQAPINHLNAVMTSQDPRLRENARKIYNRCVEKITDFNNELMQDAHILRAYKYIADGRRYRFLTEEQQTVVDSSIIAARLSGAELPLKGRRRYRKIETRIARLQEKFTNNLKDATGAWEKLVARRTMLDGIPEAAISLARSAARERSLRGYLFSLGDATFHTIMEYAKNRDLRAEFFNAWMARASKSDPRAKKLDNAHVMDEILALRHEKAKLLGFSNYAEVSLEYKMAETPEKILDFLNTLGRKARRAAIREFNILAEYAKNHDGIEELKSWDINYYLRLVRAEKQDISQEELRKYFPHTKVLAGMFEVARLLYGITIRERKKVGLWHPDAKFFDVFSPEGNLLGGIYVDLFERPGEKNGGAWMDTAVIRRELFDESIQLPVGHLVCNFSRGEKNQPSFLTMPEIETLFHEFGHNLHLVLTEARAVDVSGILGVQDDGVELPSQFMEILCWQREVLELISCHFETGKKLPYETFKKIRAARKFGYGLYITWMVTRSLYDFRLHMEYDSVKRDFVHELYRELQNDPRPIFFSEYPWAPELFTHTFEYGYEAGYYGYLWAEVLAADTHAMFVKNGKVDWSVGKRFQRQVLSRGGTRGLMKCFVAFRGRKPTIDALLRWCGFAK